MVGWLTGRASLVYLSAGRVARRRRRRLLSWIDRDLARCERSLLRIRCSIVWRRAAHTLGRRRRRRRCWLGFVLLPFGSSDLEEEFTAAPFPFGRPATRRLLTRRAQPPNRLRRARRRVCCGCELRSDALTFDQLSVDSRAPARSACWGAAAAAVDAQWVAPWQQTAARASLWARPHTWPNQSMERGAASLGVALPPQPNRRAPQASPRFRRAKSELKVTTKTPYPSGTHRPGTRQTNQTTATIGSLAPTTDSHMMPSSAALRQHPAPGACVCSSSDKHINEATQRRLSWACTVRAGRPGRLDSTSAPSGANPARPALTPTDRAFPCTDPQTLS